MKLSELARLIPGSKMLPGPDSEIVSVTSDSRAVREGALFFAIRGFKGDGREFIPDARSRGAAAIAAEDPAALKPLEGVGRLQTPAQRTALALAADVVYGHPSGKLKLIGVTGTNGKTTTVTLTAAVLEAAGIPTATLGTLGLAVRGQTHAGDRTTPEAPALQETFLDLSRDGIQAVAMEVSSHALDLDRTLGCSFDVGVFTNLTQDHLDYHSSMEEYYKAKRRLFTEYPERSEKAFIAVINVDDPFGARLAEECPTRKITYGIGGGATLVAEGPIVTPRSVSFTAAFEGKRFPVQARIGARFNVYNALAAVGAGLALGFSPEAIARGLDSARAVDGRFESVHCGQSYTVLVDYAHSPDGLSNVLRSAREITDRRVIVVFGCGGDRDTAKRPIMGEIAARLADRVIITSDNPRTERPGAIIQQILNGIPGEDASRFTAVNDRREAIQAALSEAEAGDVVVIAGKGHETYQIFADRTIHFDDREVVREILGRPASP